MVVCHFVHNVAVDVASSVLDVHALEVVAGGVEREDIKCRLTARELVNDEVSSSFIDSHLVWFIMVLHYLIINETL